MGLADYLSSHPNSPLTAENSNENHEINILTAVQYTLHTIHRKITNQKARYTNALNDVKNRSNWTDQKQIAFRHLHITKQSLSNLHRNNKFKQSTTFKLNKINKNFEDNIDNIYINVHISTRGTPH